VLRVITDPEPDLPPPQETEAVAGELDDLIGSVRSLAWIVGPAAPRTVARSDASELRVEVDASGSAEISLVLENRQAAAAPVALAVSPFRTSDGTVWAPDSQWETLVLAPDEVRPVALRLRSQSRPAPGVYEASLRLLGADDGVLRVVAQVRE
jgi:hypothetical protein